MIAASQLSIPQLSRAGPHCEEAGDVHAAAGNQAVCPTTAPKPGVTAAPPRTAECLAYVEPEVLTFILEGRLAEGYDLEALLQKVSCPALFVQGDVTLGGLEDHVAERAANHLPHGQRIKIPGAGHNVHQTQPQAALQAALRFLE